MKKRLSEIKRVEAPDHSFGKNEIFFEKVLPNTGDLNEARSANK